MSVFEIEKKAWIEDKERIISYLSTHAEYLGESKKSDVYFCQKEKDQVNIFTDTVYRLRTIEKKDKTLFEVTYKKKSLVHNTEVNKEYNFEVDDGEVFLQFTEYIGFKPFIEKTKLTQKFNYREALVEISTVLPLGDFIEVEILSTKEEETPAHIQRIDDIFEELQIPKENEESTPYVDLILKNGKQ